ncbi:helix-turn-helix transcriptional regulator, partial [Streptomyces sp. C1-2]|uniref:helix-turn-helix domain-containing protein n=1 Tax=Streptomyces sp. C1-2 TaxID=2720022 RepID=UPI001F11697D
MSEPRSAPTVGQVVLGRRLLDLRERAHLKREEAARILRVAPATVRRMETAEVALKIPYLQLLLQAYGVDEEEAAAFVPFSISKARRITNAFDQADEGKVDGLIRALTSSLVA